MVLGCCWRSQTSCTGRCASLIFPRRGSSLPELSTSPRTSISSQGTKRCEFHPSLCTTPPLSLELNREDIPSGFLGGSITLSPRGKHAPHVHWSPEILCRIFSLVHTRTPCIPIFLTDV